MTLWLWLCATALAVQVQLRAEPQALTAGQAGTVRLLVITGGSENVSVASRRPPTLTTERGLMARFLGQSQQLDNFNGRITRVVEFQYNVTAIEPGKWTVGPVQINLDDNSVATADAVTITVSERGAAASGDVEFTANAAFDAPEVWEGQAVVLIASFESKLAGAQVRWRLPTFDGLRSPQHGTPTDDHYAIDDPGGTIYVRKAYVPLVAVATGARDQGVALAEVSIPVGGADLFGFRRNRVEQVVSDRLKLDVKRLPPAPPNFSGLVGDFEITSSLSAGATNTVAVGQSVPWNVVVVGNGVVEGFELPAFRPAGASVYDQTADVTARIDGDHLKSTAAFHRVLVPTETGTLSLPPLEIVTFSPSQRAYVTSRVELPPLTVVKGREGDGAVEVYGQEAAPDTDPVAIDLRPAYTWGRATAWPLGPVLPPLLGLAGAPGLVVLGAAGLSRMADARRRRAAARQGPPTARSVLRALPSDPSERLVAFDVALRRLERALAAERAGADAETPSDPRDERLRALRAALGRARFGDGTADLSAFEAELRELVRLIEDGP